MEALNLKSNIHKIVDGIQNEELLKSLYNFLKNRQDSKSDQFWDRLSVEQKEEILLAFEESENEQNILDREQFFQRPK